MRASAAARPGLHLTSPDSGDLRCSGVAPSRQHKHPASTPCPQRGTWRFGCNAVWCVCLPRRAHVTALFVARRLWPPCVAVHAAVHAVPCSPHARRCSESPHHHHHHHPGRSCRLHNATTGAAASGRRSLVHVRDRLLDPPSSSHLGRTSAARRLLGARRPESPPANSMRVPPRHSEPDLQPPRVPGRAAGGGRSTHSGARGWAPPCRARPVEAPPTSLSSRPPHEEAS